VGHAPGEAEIAAHDRLLVLLSEAWQAPL